MSEFDKEAFLKAWDFYKRLYGPIMEPAFKTDEQARLKLIYALNRMHGKQLNEAIAHLEDIRERCCYNEDWAAWSFFVGLCFDMAGDTEHMLHCYNACISYEPAFYMPYLKAAVAEHHAADFEAAAEHYCLCLERLSENPDVPGWEEKQAVAYSSLISCLTMMHRYSEAERLFKQAGVGSADFAAVGAVLYAAMGNRPKANVQLARVEIQDEEQAAHVRSLVDEILEGKDAHFHPLPVDDEKIAAFWQHFESAEGVNTEELAQQLADLFPFLERAVEIELKPEEKKIIFRDRFAMSLQYGYGKLLAACPQSIKASWSFAVEH